MCEHHNETAHPPETLLTFPSQGRERNALRHEVPRLVHNDGGEFLQQMQWGALERLIDDAAKAKESLAKRLGTDADGRLWFKFHAKDFAEVSRSSEHRAAAASFLACYVDTLAGMIRDAETLDAAAFIANFPGQEKLAAAFVRDIVGQEGDGRTVTTILGRNVIALHRLLYHHTGSDIDCVLGLLSALPVSDPDGDKAPKTVRTAKWLKKYAALVAIRVSSNAYTPELVDRHLSSLLDGLATQSVHVCVSVNPHDFLLSATRGVCDFTSCHSLDGMHMHGNIAYARDGFTALVFLDKEGPDRGFPFFKTGRCWAYFGDQDQILFGATYGRGMSSKIVRDTMILLEQRLRPSERWRARSNVNVDWSQVSGIGGHGSPHVHTHYPGFLDTQLTRMAAPLAILANTVRLADDAEDDEEVVERSVRKLADVFPRLEFQPAFCMSCSDPIDRSSPADRTDSPFCGECNNNYDYRCDECGDGVNEDEAFHAQGSTYCESCFDENFSSCGHCSERVPNGDMRQLVFVERYTDYHGQTRTRSFDEHVCESCFEESRTCEVCDTTFLYGRRANDGHWAYDRYGDRVHVCSGCVDDSVVECADCGELYLNNASCPDAADHERAREAAAAQASVQVFENEGGVLDTQEVTHVG